MRNGPKIVIIILLFLVISSFTLLFTIVSEDYDQEQYWEEQYWEKQSWEEQSWEEPVQYTRIMSSESRSYLMKLV